MLSSDDLAVLALTKAVEGTTQELAAIASNVANLETPGYQARHISFAEQLRAALATPPHRRAAALSEVTPVVVIDRGAPSRLDGNNVQIEEELVKLGTMSLHHRVLTRLLAKKARMVEDAISGGLSR